MSVVLPNHGDQDWDTTLDAAIQSIDTAQTGHATAADPHADRAYAETQVLNHAAAVDPHGDRAYADTTDAAHLAAVNPHPQYLTASTAASTYATLAQMPGFGLQGTVPGDLAVGTAYAQGIRMDYQVTIDKFVVWVDKEPRGSSTDLVVQLQSKNRTTAVLTTRATATISRNTSRRATVSNINYTANVGDRLYVNITSVGDTTPGSDLGVSILGTLSTIPSALAAPAAPTSLTATASGADVALAWTRSASGVVDTQDIYRDGTFLARVASTATSYTDTGEALNTHVYAVEAANPDAVSTQVTRSYVPSGSINDLNVVATLATTVATSVAANGLTVTGGVAAGNYVVAAVATGGAASGATETFTITDSRGNTWTQDQVISNAPSPTQQIVIASCKVASGKDLLAGDVITFTGNSTRSVASGEARAVSGLAASSFVDTAAANSVANGTASSSLTVATNGALAQAKNYVLSAYCIVPTTFTSGSGWTADSVTSANPSNNRELIVEFQIVNSTAAVTSTVTNLGTGSKYAAAIVPYKGA